MLLTNGTVVATCRVRVGFQADRAPRALRAASQTTAEPELDLAIAFVAPSSGEFTAPQENLIVSREGFTVRTQLPNTVVYREAGLELRIFVELLMTDQLALATRYTDLRGARESVHAGAPSDDDLFRALRRVQRALAWSGTTLVVL